MLHPSLKHGLTLYGQVHVATTEAVMETAAGIDWPATAEDLDKKSPLEIMDHVRSQDFLLMREYL